MASSSLAPVLLELADRDVTVRDGRQYGDHDGSLSLTGDRADGTVTLELAADPAAARERSMAVTLADEDAAALEAALADARAED